MRRPLLALVLLLAVPMPAAAAEAPARSAPPLATVIPAEPDDTFAELGRLGTVQTRDPARIRRPIRVRPLLLYLCTGLLLIFVPLAVRLYRRLT